MKWSAYIRLLLFIRKRNEACHILIEIEIHSGNDKCRYGHSHDEMHRIASEEKYYSVEFDKSNDKFINLTNLGFYGEAQFIFTYKGA